MINAPFQPNETDAVPEWFNGLCNSGILFGPDVPSVAGVITLPFRYQRVTGALAITGIALSFGNPLVASVPDFAGIVSVFPTGAFTWTNATNIVVAGTAVVGRKLDFFYFPPQAKWYPSYV